MNVKRLLCLPCAAILLGLLMTGCGGQADLISDAEEVVGHVLDMAEGFAGPSAPPATMEPELPREAAPEPPSAPEHAAGNSGELRPGRYTGPDGSVLNVTEDGACTYETLVSGTIDGQEMSGPIVFHGTVEDGRISFVKVTYYGLDITALAAAAGYDDPSAWEAAAESIYTG